jgi:hypothetical protein
MTGKGHPLLGKWRITTMELWDAAFIDLLGPGYIRFDTEGGKAIGLLTSGDASVRQQVPLLGRDGSNCHRHPESPLWG